MAKKDEIQGVQCENADFEIMRRQLARLEKTLTENLTEVNKRIDNISIQPPVFPPPAALQPQEPIEVNLPDNIAKSEDVVKLSGIIQTLNSTVSLVMKSLAEMQKQFAAIPRPDVQSIVQETACAVAQQVVGNLSPKIDDSVSKAMQKGASNAPGISLNDAASIHRTLKETNNRIDAGKSVDTVYKWNLRLSLGLFISVFVVFGFGCWIYDLSNERDELLKVEWLYRSVRSIINESDTEVIMKMEKEILSGTDEQRDSIKTQTVKREEIGIPFHNFQSHDAWQPKPPKPQPEKTKSAKETEIDKEPLPHQRKSRLTPGEIQAIKDMRASPNIPEDAKPELPEGYK